MTSRMKVGEADPGEALELPFSPFNDPERDDFLHFLHNLQMIFYNFCHTFDPGSTFYSFYLNKNIDCHM